MLCIHTYKHTYICICMQAKLIYMYSYSENFHFYCVTLIDTNKLIMIASHIMTRFIAMKNCGLLHKNAVNMPKPTIEL